MRLLWSELRCLYEIPSEVALPADRGPVMPGAARFLFAAWGVGLAVMGIPLLVPMFALSIEGALENPLQGGLQISLLMVLGIHWWLAARHRPRDENAHAEPQIASRDDPIDTTALSWLSAMAARIPGFVGPMALGGTRLSSLMGAASAMFAFFIVILTDWSFRTLAIPVLLLAFLPAINIIRVFRALARVRSRLAAGRCIRCRYDLAGLSTDPRWIECPECGAMCPAGPPLVREALGAT